MLFRKEKRENIFEVKKETRVDEATIQMIRSKIRKPGFEVNIRLMGVAKDRQRSEEILRNLESSFSQFMSGLNGFGFVKAKKGRNLKQIIYDFSFRNFRRGQSIILNSEELTSIYHLPLSHIESPYIKWVKTKEAPPPSELPDAGLLSLGEAVYRGEKRKVYVASEEDRRRHFYIIGQTGTGKTAAFLIPLINKVLEDYKKRVLIMTPTRELATQIESEFRIFAKNLNLYSALFIGGTSMSSQIRNLKRSPHFVIGTPGRLIDLTKRKKIDLNSFSILVLDEVDRMLDMGFINDMEFVIKLMPVQRQTLFFSATLPIKLNQIITRFSRNPVKVEIKTKETTANVNQSIVKINGQSKVEILNSLLKSKGFDKVLVFGRTKHGLNKLAKELFGKGFRVATIHGNKSQSQRQKALTQFKTERVQVLLATDVASRGLDIDNVTHVINYDLPESQEAYIHRIGRTGRANKFGTALSFVD